MDIVIIVNPHPAVIIIVSIILVIHRSPVVVRFSPFLFLFFFNFILFNCVVQMLSGWTAPGFSQTPLKEESFHPWGE